MLSERFNPNAGWFWILAAGMLFTADLLLLTEKLSGRVKQEAGSYDHVRSVKANGVLSNIRDPGTQSGRLVRLLDHSMGPVQVDFQLVLRSVDKGRRKVIIRVSPEDAEDLNSPARGRIDLVLSADPNNRGEKLNGRVIDIVAWQFSDRWEKAGTTPMTFWPSNEKQANTLLSMGYRRQMWHRRALSCRFAIYDSEIRFYFENRLIKRWPRREDKSGTSLVMNLDGGDELHNVMVSPLKPLGLHEEVDLAGLARQRLSARAVAPPGPIPLALVDDGRLVLDLSHARWVDQKRDPADLYEAYDHGSYVLNDRRMPMLSIPKADYVAAHVLASATRDPKMGNTISLRMGRYGGREQVVRRDYYANVPKRGENAFQVVRIPLMEVVAQDVIGDLLEVEVTKRLRLARRLPDPNRFRRRPLGLPAGVRIAAITFEKSPLQMRVSSDESGHVFVAPTQAMMSVSLENITSRPQTYQLTGTARHLHGVTLNTLASGVVAPHKTSLVRLAVPDGPLGYYDFDVELRNGSGQVLLRRTTSFARLPPDKRQHRSSSPFGTWEWYGTHVTSTDSDQVGSLYKKLGFRFGMSRHSLESRKKWGTSHAIQAKLDSQLKTYEAWLARNPDLSEVVLQFHEDTVSSRHAMRVPDLFVNSGPFEMNTYEKERYARMWDDALSAASRLRKQHPGVKISFGNGVPATKEEFFRRGYPAHAFDFAGNEAGCFHRVPETQPPDFIALNASIWMDEQLLKAYGYTDKRVYQSYETCYPGDNPGNLSSTAQADYFVRHALHSLAWGMEFIHIGMLMDVGNSYYFSNWGASGFLNAVPEVNVKPAFVALATLTQVLDGATFLKAHATGSPSLYGLEFMRRDGQHVLVYWTIRGQRALTVTHQGESWTSIDDQGNEAAEPSRLVATPSPKYLVGKGQVLAVLAEKPSYDDQPPRRAWAIASFGKFGTWREVVGRSEELERYNFMEPRRRGEFRFEGIASFEGRGPSLRVTPEAVSRGTDTMPMYERLVLERPVKLPERPNEIGVWVNGNSGWGRVIFELRDVQGERWISLGAETDIDGRPTSDWSADDPYGISAINHDGWRYIGFPLPGNYAGERHPWPVNSNWRWNGDGVVQYPLSLVGVAITLRSKVLHVKDWAPPPRREIYLEDVLVGWRERWLE